MSNRHIKPLRKSDYTKNAKLVGKRIDPKSPLGIELAKLRTMYAAAGEITTPTIDLERRMLETSLNVEAPLNALAMKKALDERKKVIRERVQGVLDKIMAEHGRYPTTVGIPAETFEEVREACHDFPVTFVVQPEED